MRYVLRSLKKLMAGKDAGNDKIRFVDIALP